MRPAPSILDHLADRQANRRSSMGEGMEEDDADRAGDAWAAALLSDAGTPIVTDRGARLGDPALEEGTPVLGEAPRDETPILGEAPREFEFAEAQEIASEYILLLLSLAAPWLLPTISPQMGKEVSNCCSRGCLLGESPRPPLTWRWGREESWYGDASGAAGSESGCPSKLSLGDRRAASAGRKGEKREEKWGSII